MLKYIKFLLVHLCPVEIPQNLPQQPHGVILEQSVLSNGHRQTTVVVEPFSEFFDERLSLDANLLWQGREVRSWDERLDRRVGPTQSDESAQIIDPDLGCR